MQRILIDSATFDALAVGDGGIVGPLRSGQRSKRLLLLHELISRLAAEVPELCATAGTKEAYDVLVEAQRRDPAADVVILQPHVGAWAMACLRRLVAGQEPSPEDVGHLGAIAAAAALRVGCEFEVTAYARDHVVMLPTYGAARVPDLVGWCRLRGGPEVAGVEVRSSTRTYLIPVDARDERPTWQPLRHLRATSGDLTFDAVLEDLDPYRDCGHLPVASRLDDATAAAWQDVLARAWPLLVEDDRDRAEALAAGISSVVPLLATTTATELSASCHEAMGAVAMTEPGNPLTMALALVHEHQHNKLSAVLDLVPLLTLSPGNRYLAPWRPDPRPLKGLIHGTYAFLGLTRFWESIRHRSRAWDPEAAEEWAHFEFALGRRQVGATVETLLGSGGLTAPGERFVRRMQGAVADLHRLAVPSVADDLAELAAADHATAWRLRNCRPDGGQIDEWARAWRRDAPCRWPDGPAADIVDGGRRIASDTRQRLIRHHLAHPDSWRERVVDASGGDVALVVGDLDRAAHLYQTQVEADPDDEASWAGLALARRGSPEPAAVALARHPELVRALYQAVASEGPARPSVMAVAEWLGCGLVTAQRP